MQLFRFFTKRTKRKAAPRKPSVCRRRLQVEALEERLVLTGGCMCPICQGVNLLPALGASSAPSTPALAITLAAAPAVPALSSNPGAPATLYLDFNGHFESTWGGYKNVSTPTFDLDGNPASFSQLELDAIDEIWQRVAEDYAPFKINVTTVDPGNFADRVGFRIAIGGTYQDWLGQSAGGVAYIDSFTSPYIVNTGYVFPTNLSRNPKYISEAVSHEAGHGFGLDHQSLYNAGGGKVNEYNPGTAERAPIMGNSYTTARGTWWYGTADSSTSYQDDMSMLARPANGFGYRADDHGDSFAAATAMTAGGSQATVAGVVITTSDVDMFAFATSGGQVSLAASVAAVGANLDARLDLYSASGQLLASADPSGSLSATITTTLAAGNYYVSIRSHGTYGDVGQYTLSMSGTVALVSPTDAYVMALYIDILGRTSSPGEVSLWSTRLNQGMPHNQLVSSFLNSTEKRIQVITSYYQQYLGHAPDAGGLNGWLTLLANGGRREDVAAGILGSAEYFALQGGSTAQFVKGLYRDVVGRGAGQAEIDTWVGVLGKGIPRDVVARSFLASDEFRLNLVADCYTDLLQRKLDPSGQGFVEFLRQGATQEQVQLAFLCCQEYQAAAVNRFAK